MSEDIYINDPENQTYVAVSTLALSGVYRIICLDL